MEPGVDGKTTRLCVSEGLHQARNKRPFNDCESTKTVTVLR
jgi:hypothetical protein